MPISQKLLLILQTISKYQAFMKKLFFLAAIMMMVISASAQDEFDDDGIGPDKRKNVVSLGIKAEGNYSSMSKYDDVDLGLKSGVGFGGGLVIAAHFGKRTRGSDPGTGLFGIQIEPSYIQHTIGTNSEDIKISYFEAPVLMSLSTRASSTLPPRSTIMFSNISLREL